MAGSWVLLWWLLWYLSVLAGRVVASLGAGGWGEQRVTSVAMGPAGGLGSLTALSSGIACWPPLRLLGRLSAMGHGCPGCVPDGRLLLVGEQNGRLVWEGWSPLPPLGMVFDV